MAPSGARLLVHRSAARLAQAMSIQVFRYLGDGAEWDQYVRGQPQWTHFHLHGWRSVIEGVFNHECIYLGARSSTGALEGILPLVRVRSMMFGHFLVSMPFVNYGGPLGSERAVRALCEESVRIAKADRVQLLELRSRQPLATPLPASHRKITMLLDLPQSDDLLWRS